MKTHVVLMAVVMAAACQADTKNLNDRMERIEKKLDQVIAQGGRPGAAPGAAGQQRPQRPEPDRSKTYSMPIENDPFEGPANAKVTLIEAFDYA